MTSKLWPNELTDNEPNFICHCSFYDKLHIILANNKKWRETVIIEMDIEECL